MLRRYAVRAERVHLVQRDRVIAWRADLARQVGQLGAADDAYRVRAVEQVVQSAGVPRAEVERVHEQIERVGCDRVAVERLADQGRVLRGGWSVRAQHLTDGDGID